MMIACNATTQPGSANNGANESHATVSQAITELEINWAAGSIAIVPTDDSVISFSESADVLLTPENSMHYEVEVGQLEIDYQANEKSFAQIGTSQNKALVVRIPRQMSLDELTIDGANLDVSIDSILCREISINGVRTHTTARLTHLPQEIECNGVSQHLQLLVPEGSMVYAEASGIYAKVSNEMNCLKHMAQCRVDANGAKCNVEVSKL